MDGKRITAEQIMGAIGTDVERMAQKVADALNCAEAGAIIDQSEEPVRDALAEFRRHTYQKAMDLLSESQQAFSPSGRRAPTGWRNKGRQTTTHLTMNGRLTVKDNAESVMGLASLYYSNQWDNYWKLGQKAA